MKNINITGFGAHIKSTLLAGAVLLAALCLSTGAAAGTQIFVRLPVGTHITLEVELTDRIEDVKEKLQNQQGIPVSYQILFYGGAELEDGNTLQDYLIQKDAVLHLVQTDIIDMSDPNPPQSGTGWTYSGDVYRILNGANVTVIGTSANSRRIEVDDIGATATITLDNVDINANAYYYAWTPISIGSGANVTLILMNSNSVTGGNGAPGIKVGGSGTTTLTISGSGSLTAQGSRYSAGIDCYSSSSYNGNNITINSGEITATGGADGGAGIGGGRNDNITINGGTVTAIGGADGGAGIGGGQYGDGGTITINGGTINATGGQYSAGIGGARNGEGGTITISGGTVTATRGQDSNKGDIGPGYSGYNGTVTITGGSIKCANGIVPQPKKDMSTEVYLTTLTVSSVGDDIPLIAAGYILSGSNITNYGVNDVVTRDGSNIYCYLPAKTSYAYREIVVALSGAKYTNGTAIEVTNNNAATGVLGDDAPQSLYTSTLTIKKDGSNWNSHNRLLSVPGLALQNKNTATVTAQSFNSSGEEYVYDGAENTGIRIYMSGSSATLNYYETSISNYSVSGTGSFTYSGGQWSVMLSPISSGAGPKTVYYTGTGGTSYGPTTTAPINAGEYTVTADVAEGTWSSAKLYLATTGLSVGTLTINKATVTNTGSTTTVTYTGSTIDLSSVSDLFTVSGNAGTRTYTDEGGGTGEGSISNNLLTVTKAGTFNIGLVTAATSNYEAGAKVTATLTVNKGTQTGFAFAAPNPSATYVSGFTYTQAASGGEGGGTVTYAIIGGDGTASINVSSGQIHTVTVAGTIQVEATKAADDLYNEATADYTLTIAKATLAATVSLAGWTYGSMAGTPSVSNNTENGTVTYQYDVASGGDFANTTQPTDAGTYYIRAAIAATDNYDVFTTPAVQFTIAKASSGLSATDLSVNLVVGTSGSTLTADLSSITLAPTDHGTVTYTLGTFNTNDGVLSVAPTLNIDGHTLEYGYDATSSSTGHTSTQAITITTANYEDISANVVFEVTSKTSVTISGVSVSTKTYDGTPIAASGSPNVAGGTADKALIWLYTGTETDGTSYSNVAPPTKAGTYNLNISTDPADVVSGSVGIPFTINKLDLTHDVVVTPTKVYDGTAAATHSGGLTNVIGGDDVTLSAVLTYAAGADVQTSGNITASTWSISGTDADNYTLPSFIAQSANITAKPQTITFTPSSTLSLESDTYTLVATTENGLLVKFRISGSTASADIDASQNTLLHLYQSGDVTVTAYIDDSNYQAADVSRTLTVASNNKDVSAVAVSGVTPQAGKPDFYLADCGTTSVQIAVTLEESGSQVIYNGTVGSTFSVDISRPDIHEVAYTVQSTDGSTKPYTLQIERPFAFTDIVGTKFNNVLYVNNNPANNGGYKFTNYQWYKDGHLIGDEQVYSAGNSRTDLLDPAADYSVAVTTVDGKLLHVCPDKVTLESVSSLRAYPNPVAQGAQVTLESPTTDGRQAHIYNISGELIGSGQTLNGKVQFTAPQATGVYLLTVDGKTVKVVVE